MEMRRAKESMAPGSDAASGAPTTMPTMLMMARSGSVSSFSSDDNATCVTMSSDGEQRRSPPPSMRKFPTESDLYALGKSRPVPKMTERKTPKGLAYATCVVGVDGDGDCPTLLFAHGTGLNSGSWVAAIAALHAEFIRRGHSEDGKVVSMDNLCGLAEAPSLRAAAASSSLKVRKGGGGGLGGVVTGKPQPRRARVIALDWQGHGLSSTQQELEDDEFDWVGSAASDVRDVLRAEGLLLADDDDGLQREDDDELFVPATTQEDDYDDEKEEEGHDQDGAWTTTPPRQQQQRVIGVGHSIGCAALVALEVLEPKTFAGLALFEPILSPPGGEERFDLASFKVVASSLALQAKRRTLVLNPPVETLGPQLRGAIRSYGGIFDRWHDDAVQAFAERGFFPTEFAATTDDDDDDCAQMRRTPRAYRPRCSPACESAAFEGAPAVVAKLADRLDEVTCPVAVAAGARSNVLAHAAPPAYKGAQDASNKLMADVAACFRVRATKRDLPGVPRAAWRYPSLAVSPHTTHFVPMEQPTWTAKFVAEVVHWLAPTPNNLYGGLARIDSRGY